MGVILTVINDFTDNLLIGLNGNPTTFTVAGSPYVLSDFWANDEIRSSSDMQTALTNSDATISVNGVNITDIQTLGTNKTVEAGDLSVSFNSDDITEGSTNKYFIDAPNDSKQYARENGAWQEVESINPANDGILTNYIDSQNNNRQSTNSVFPNLTTYLTLIASGIDITSDYRFELSFSISINTTNRNAVVDIKDFGVSILPQVYTVEVKDVTNRKWVTISGRITPNPLGAGQIQLQLDFGADQGGGTISTMYFANISLSKIN